MSDLRRYMGNFLFFNDGENDGFHGIPSSFPPSSNRFYFKTFDFMWTFIKKRILGGADSGNKKIFDKALQNSVFDYFWGG